LDSKNILSSHDVIPHVYFIDLRALSNMKFTLSPEEMEVYRRWQKRLAYAEDNGVHPMD